MSKKSRTPIVWVDDDGKGGVRVVGIWMPTIRNPDGSQQIEQSSGEKVRIWHVDRHGGIFWKRKSRQVRS